MKPDDVRALVSRLISDIAPDADVATLKDNADIREAFDLDSMDFLNFIIALNKATGVPIPEKDAGKLLSMKGIIAYLDR